jgi:hypothetical protein
MVFYYEFIVNFNLLKTIYSLSFYLFLPFVQKHLLFPSHELIIVLLLALDERNREREGVWGEREKKRRKRRRRRKRMKENTH